MNIEAGKTIEVVYPFTREIFYDMDEEGYGKTLCWRPGIYREMLKTWGDPEVFAEGEGVMLLTVVSIHKPGKYLERVFYTRKWRDPDGKEFGKGTLRNCTMKKFQRLAKRYGYEYQIRQRTQDEREAA